MIDEKIKYFTISFVILFLYCFTTGLFSVYTYCLQILDKYK